MPIPVPVLPPSPRPESGLRHCSRWLWALAATVLVFSWPLVQLGRFALSHDLYSHVILVPLISAYFVWINRATLQLSGRLAVAAALPWLIGAIALLAWSGIGAFYEQYFGSADAVAIITGAFVCVIAGITTLFFGRAIKTVFFPLAFLIFLVPMPEAMTDYIESLLQYGSAAVAYIMFSAVGATVYHEGLLFHLPGISLEVAPECSGIHSTLALLITSIVAGQLFLRSAWARTTLAVAIIPLALLRNGFRVFTLGELCVHIGPHMIDSPIHHKGGPLFFALSLIPFAFLLRALVKAERTHRTSPSVVPA
jgi:exosortase C (VPDSG-CTERM-specific)